MPFVTESFKKEYLIPYYIGESLFGVIPSFLALIQGAGEDAMCHNITIGNETTLQQVDIIPIFSVSNYFRIIFVFLALSSAAFILMNCLDLKRHQHDTNAKTNTISHNNHHHDIDSNDVDQTSSKLLESEHGEVIKIVKSDKSNNTRREKFILYALNFLITFFYYGVLPGLQSYSTIPYGKLNLFLSLKLEVYLYLK